MTVSFPLDTFSLHKHYFVLTRRELGGRGRNAYLRGGGKKIRITTKARARERERKKRGTRPLHRPYGVTSREDCNNRDRRARRMRRHIKAGGEETLRLISRQRITQPPSSPPTAPPAPHHSSSLPTLYLPGQRLAPRSLTLSVAGAR